MAKSIRMRASTFVAVALMHFKQFKVSSLGARTFNDEWICVTTSLGSCCIPSSSEDAISLDPWIGEFCQQGMSPACKEGKEQMTCHWVQHFQPLPFFNLRRRKQRANTHMGNSRSKTRAREDAGTAAVFNAVLFDSLPDLQALVISKGVTSVHVRNVDGTTPLFGARSVGVAAFLVENGANISTRNKYNETPLGYMAILREDLAVAEFLLENGADANAAGVHEKTALHRVTSTKAVRLLVKHGAHVNATDKYGRPPLSDAILLNRAPVIEALLEAGADVTLLDKSGESFMLFLPPIFSRTTLEKLVDHGVSVNVCSKSVDTPLHWAATTGSVDLLGYMIDYGIPIDSASTIQGTPLYVAATHGHLDVVQYLLEKNASVHGDELFERVPLCGAAMQGKVDVMVELVTYGASFNSKTSADESRILSTHLPPESSILAIVDPMIENLSEIIPYTTVLDMWLAKITELCRAIPDMEGFCERLAQRLDMTLNLIKSGKIMPSKVNMTKFALLALHVWK